LVQSGFGADNSGLQELVLSIPSVVFNASAMPGIRTVRLDDSTASAIATRHLVELGHTRIAFVGAEGASSDRRFQGYAEALDDAGLQSLPMVSGGWSASEARKGIEQYFWSGGRATALVVATSTSALGVHAGVISSGRSVPDDVYLVCIQDAWFAEHLNPPLTPVEVPLGDVGCRAVTLPIEGVASHTEGEVVLGDPSPALIERESTSVPRAEPVRDTQRDGAHGRAGCQRDAVWSASRRRSPRRRSRWSIRRRSLYCYGFARRARRGSSSPIPR